MALPKSGKLRAAAQAALAAVDSTLSVPDLGEPIPVVATQGKNKRGGFTRKPVGTPDRFVPGSIRISTRPTELESFSLEATLAHEVAHFLDCAAFSDPTGDVQESQRARFGSLSPDVQEDWMVKAREAGNDRLVGVFGRWMANPGSPLDEWYRTVSETDSVKQLGSASMMEYGTHEYLLRPTELWARSFSQWLAMRSGDPKLAAWLREAQNVPETMEKTTENWKGEKVAHMAKTPNHLRVRQWQDEDFAPVAASLDRLFSGLGWTSA